MHDSQGTIIGWRSESETQQVQSHRVNDFFPRGILISTKGIIAAFCSISLFYTCNIHLLYSYINSPLKCKMFGFD